MLYLFGFKKVKGDFEQNSVVVHKQNVHFLFHVALYGLVAGEPIKLQNVFRGVYKTVCGWAGFTGGVSLSRMCNTCFLECS